MNVAAIGSMELKLKFLMVNLLALSCVCRDNNTYYVRPYFPQHVDCQAGYQCDSLQNYGTATNELGLSENNTATMILIEGYHTIDSSVYNFGCPVNPYTLHFIGNGNDTASVVVHYIETAITVKNMILEGFVGSSIFLYIDKSVVNSQITNISISNCTFIESTMILTNVNLTIEDSNFTDSISTPIMLFSSTLTIVGHVWFYNNRGYQGGALMLVVTIMNIAREANLLFQENHAENTGGAIFVMHPQMMINLHGVYSSCFYQLLDYDEISTYSIKFINNSAATGGDHIYGASLKNGCFLAEDSISSYEIFNQFFWFDPGYDSLLSAVSADATRACICDENGLPVCKTADVGILTYPGAQFSLPVVVVGGDYGTTTGTVHVSFLNETSTSLLGSSNQQHDSELITKNSECSRLNFSVNSNESSDIMFLTVQEAHIKSVEEFYYDYTYRICITIHLFDDNDTIYYDDYDDYDDCDKIETDIKSRSTPLFVFIDFLPCPSGFILSGNPTGCQCHPVLTANGVDCILNQLNGYHRWNSTNLWIQAVDNDESKAIIFSTHCPFRYCNPSGKDVNLSNPDSQCAFNRAGILCGGCKKNYSLAIGSSRCIHCQNNNNLALLILFIAAGIFLVLFIAALNLTVTQGMINSLVFLIWAFQNILLPSGFGRELIVHKTFIAWLSLDFGIETCFFHGMNAYTKMWLQFI
jgi:predicted outer membrane repeat protein